MGAKMAKRRKIVVCGGIYRRIIIFVFDILRKQGFTMFPLKSFYPQLFISKTDQTPQADVPNPFVSFLNTFFLCFKEKSISVCITVLYYIIILIAVFSKSLSRQFVKNSISISLFSKARYLRYTSNPQPIGFRGNLLVKRQKFFYCTYSLGITETS